MKTAKRQRISTKLVSTKDTKSLKKEMEAKIPLERKYRFYGLDRTTPEN